MHSSSSRPQGYLENGVNGGAKIARSGIGGDGGSERRKLSAVGPSPIISVEGRQRPQGRQAPRSSQGGSPSRMRFAYIPLLDPRRSAPVESDSSGRVSNASARVQASAVWETGRKASNEPAAVGKRENGRGVTEDVGVGEALTAGDSGSWSTSMQALCAMLRARRRDPSLAALIFLALEACISEWAQACDTMPEQLATRSGGRRSFQSSSAAKSAIRPTLTKGSENGQGWVVPSGPVEPESKGASALEGSLPLATIVARGRVFTGRREKEISSVVSAREKMALGAKESLKAGLMWAEAIPLGRSKAAIPDRLDRRGLTTGLMGTSNRTSIVYAHVHQTSSEPSIHDTSFTPAVSGAVECLMRYEVRCRQKAWQWNCGCFKLSTVRVA